MTPNSWSVNWPRCMSAPVARSCFSVFVLEDHSGSLVLEVEGKGASSFFAGESGGHRFQRIPPTERRGRVHTSTVTVAVIPDSPSGFRLNLSEVTIETYRAGGKGGQHRNKTETAIRARHLPTGLVACAASEKSQKQNKRSALKVLAARLASQEAAQAASATNRSRRAQIGGGARGDKRRTYRERDDRVTDHKTGRRTRLSKLRRGDWSELL